MAELMELIDRERVKAELSAERFANLSHVTTSTFTRQKRGEQGLGLDSIQGYARYFKATGNIDMLRAIAAFVVGLEPEQIKIDSN